MQTEVFWHGRWYRIDQSYNIYSDILAIAASLEDKFGPETRDVPIKNLEWKIGKHRGGVRLQTEGTPLSRQVFHRCNELYQASKTGNEDAYEELKLLTANHGLRLPEAELILTHSEESHHPIEDAQYLPAIALETLEGDAQSLLPRSSENHISQTDLQDSLDASGWPPLPRAAFDSGRV